MQSETLVEEFSRLVREYKQDDGPGGIEAWNLIADFAVDNAEAIEAALSAAEPWPFEHQNYNCPCIHPSQCDESCVKKPAPSVAVRALEATKYASELRRISLFVGNPDGDLVKTITSVADYLSALSAQVQDVAGWRPIEAAPKDGTPVILWTVWLGDEISPDPFSEVQIGYWDHGNDLPESHDFSRRPEWAVQKIGEPTHWMPLPAAPAKQEG